MTEPEKLTEIFKTLKSEALIEIGLIVAVAIVLIVLLGRILPWVGNKLHGKRRLYILASVPLLRLLIIVATLMLIVPRIIEPTLQNMVAILGAAGLAIGFALKDYVSSLMAGVVALHEFPYRQGDWIEVDGAYGEVKHIGMRTVEIVTPDDTLVFIPHQKLWSELIFNANDGGATLMCVAHVYVEPEHDAAVVQQQLHDIALTSPFLHLERPILVVVEEKPGYTHYRLKAYPIEARQQFQFITDLTVRAKAALAMLGVKPAQPWPGDRSQPGA